MRFVTLKRLSFSSGIFSNCEHGSLVKVFPSGMFVFLLPLLHQECLRISLHMRFESRLLIRLDPAVVYMIISIL